MRPEIQLFIADEPLPDWNGSEEEIDRRYQQLQTIPRPVTAEEAEALTACFGPDDCYGVAWTLLHLIETGPGPVAAVSPPGPDTADNDWRHVLWARWGTTAISRPDGPSDRADQRKASVHEVAARRADPHL
ncbi:hypothetical protein [Streptomyces sp. NPDC048357]|uniref:hypothetical protein n=1 Tax=Streptomyces sp. NPDC048357 TaxID=3154719 RepID=UPI0034446AF9